MRLVLYQPDIPQNVGAAIRAAACFGAALEIVEPCGFPLDGRAVKRAAMDYGALTEIGRHASWEAFLESPARASGRLILLTTGTDRTIYDCAFEQTDLVMLGRESAGAPEAVHAAADIRATIPLAPGARSLNVVVAGAVALAEARRQLAKKAQPT